MWIPDPKYLGAGHDSSLFLLAAWNELFNPYTPDTYQPRLHNTPSLIEELDGVSQRVDESTVWWKHIKKIQEELRRVSEEDQDLLNQLPEYQWQIDRVIKSDNENDIKLYCKLLRNRKIEYDTLLQSTVEKLADELPAGKRNAYKGLRRLATQAIRLGKEDDDVINNLPDPSQKCDLVLREIIQTSSHGDENYECVFAVIGQQSDIQRIARRIKFDLIRQNRLPKLQVNKLIQIHTEVSFVGIKHAASSIRDAVNKGREALNVGVDIVNLYSNSAALQIANMVFVKRVGSNNYTVLDQSEQVFRRLHSRTRPAEDSLSALKMVSMNRLEDSVLSALELHSLAIVSSEPRIKLLNLWSAMECLASCLEKDSIIERVTSLATSILVWRRVDKIVRYLSLAVRDFGAAVTKYNFGGGFARSKNDFVHPWDMMCTLCLPDEHQNMRELLAFCSQHPLLVFRVNCLWEEFHDPLVLRKKLLLSQDRLQWQLHRIYRARNLLIHDGTQVPELPFLLDNLHYYSSIILQRIIHAMKISENWGVHEAIMYWNAKTTFILESLNDRPEILRIGDFFPMESQADSPHLWPRLEN